MDFYTITDDEWIKKYQPTTNEMLPYLPIDTTPEYIWTVIDGDDCQTISSGIHLVNRIGYYQTKQPHDFLVDVIDD